MAWDRNGGGAGALDDLTAVFGSDIVVNHSGGCEVRIVFAVKSGTPHLIRFGVTRAPDNG